MFEIHRIHKKESETRVSRLVENKKIAPFIPDFVTLNSHEIVVDFSEEQEAAKRIANCISVDILGVNKDKADKIMSRVMRKVQEDEDLPIIPIGARKNGFMGVFTYFDTEEHFNQALYDLNRFKSFLEEELEPYNARALIGIVEGDANAIINIDQNGNPNLDFHDHIPPTHAAWNMMVYKKNSDELLDSVTIQLISPSVIEESDEDSLWDKSESSQKVKTPKGSGFYYRRNVTSLVENSQPQFVSNVTDNEVNIENSSFLNSRLIDFITKYAKTGYIEQITSEGRVEINLGPGSGFIQIKIDFSGLSNLVADSNEPGNLMGEMLMAYMQDYSSNMDYVSTMEGDALNLIIPDAFLDTQDFLDFVDYISRAQNNFVETFLNRKKSAQTDDFVAKVAEHEAGMKVVIFSPDMLNLKIYSGGIIVVDNPMQEVESIAESMAKQGGTDLSIVRNVPIVQDEWENYFGKRNVFEEILYINGETIYVYRVDTSPSILESIFEEVIADNQSLIEIWEKLDKTLINIFSQINSISNQDIAIAKIIFIMQQKEFQADLLRNLFPRLSSKTKKLFEDMENGLEKKADVQKVLDIILND